MNLRKHNQQQGVALVLAIIIALILFLMGFMLFALSNSLLRLDKGRRSHLQNQVTVHQAFRNVSVNQAFVYNQNTVPALNSGSVELVPDEPYTFEITNNHIDNGSNQRFTSFIMPESGYTMRTIDYYLDLTTNEGYHKNVTIRVPSNTHRTSDTSINKSSIALNIPAINFSNLSEQQLSNGSIDPVQRQVGYVADLEILNNNTLRLTPVDGSTPQTLSLGNNIDPNTFALTQGWRLVNGQWRLSIGLYDAVNSVQGCVIEARWTSYLSGFASLSCVNLGLEEPPVPVTGPRYPNPAGFPMCEENVSYAQGHVCQEDGILFKANISNATGLPLTNNTDWRIYYPNSDWVAPYTQGGIYDTGDLVVYDKTLYRVQQDDERDDPLKWEEKATIESYDPTVSKYSSGDVIVHEGSFLKKKNNSSNKDPSQEQHWQDLGPTLEQEEINTLAPQIQKIVSAGMSALSFTPEEIVFPYRQEYPSQELLNCIGQYPSIDTSVYNQCIQGKVYNTGDMCYENNMLFRAKWWTSNSPYHSANSWELYLPGPDWVVPYSENVFYGDTPTKVIYDKKRFTNAWYVNKGVNPYQNSAWRIDGVYEWNTNIEYRENDIVIQNNNFYRAKWWNKGLEPYNNSGPSGAWQDLGTTYEDKTAEEVLTSCDAYYQEEASEYNNGDDAITELVYGLFNGTVGSSADETRYSLEGTPLANLDGDTATLIATGNLSNGELRMFLTNDQKQSILDGNTSLTDANNYVELMFADNLAVRTSYGDDTLDAIGMTNSAIATFSDSDTVNITDSENNLYVLDPAASTLLEEPLASYGDDRLTLGSSINDTILMGGGNDTADITLAQGLDLSATEGNDTINIGTSVGVKNISTGDGDDSVTIGSGDNGDLSKDVGSWDNGIRTGDGNDTISVGAGTNVLHAGRGDDAVTVDWSGDNKATFAGNYNGSSGNDSLVIRAEGKALRELRREYISDPGLFEVTTNFSDGNTFVTRSFENIKIIDSKTGSEVFSGTRRPGGGWDKVY
ncbi:hypothetical protein [Francisella sp. LA112445]|uniref:hypothetical protein n=1 Tax=Francisella sp. LA112445 TaxID=1395624 RepID=UPI001788C121|nr:hypothetical protein [Francisella sp. LA112445]QIW09455.1 hypothetical protein FIP56_01670 [Francisella sp. LA112445]